MRAREGRRSEAGQTTALVCAMLFTLAMFVALVVNVGQMVNRRVALQLVADAGAWSGATVQAVQLNHYAFWSRLVQNAYKNASGVSFGFRVSECWSGVAAVSLFYYAQSGMVRAGANFLNKAYSEAQRHSLFNIDDLFPGERNNFDFSTVAGPNDGAVIAPLNGNIIPVRSVGATGSTPAITPGAARRPCNWRPSSARRSGRLPWAVSRAGSGNENWQCGTLLPPTSFRIYMVVPAGYKLQTPGQPFIFVWRVSERRATRAFFFDRFLGPNAVPAMTAVAVAKAVGGDVHRGRSRYRAKMVPVSRYSLTGGFIQIPRRAPAASFPIPFAASCTEPTHVHPTTQTPQPERHSRHRDADAHVDPDRLRGGGVAVVPGQPGDLLLGGQCAHADVQRRLDRQLLQQDQSMHLQLGPARAGPVASRQHAGGAGLDGGHVQSAVAGPTAASGVVRRRHAAAGRLQAHPHGRRDLLSHLPVCEVRRLYGQSVSVPGMGFC